MESKPYRVFSALGNSKETEEIANKMWDAGYELVAANYYFMYFKKRDL